MMTLGLAIALSSAILLALAGVSLLVGGLLAMQDTTLPPTPAGGAGNPLTLFRTLGLRKLLAGCRCNWPSRSALHILFYAGALALLMALALCGFVILSL